MISEGRLIHVMGLIARARKVLDEAEEDALHGPEEGYDSELINKAINLLAEADLHGRLIDQPLDQVGVNANQLPP